MARSVAAVALLGAACQASNALGTGALPDLTTLYSRHGIALDQYNLTDELLASAPHGWQDNARSSSRRLFHENFKLYFGCGVDNPYQDMFSTTIGGKIDCFVVCDMFVLACEGAVWTSYQGGTCWWKKPLDLYTAKPKSDAATAIFLTSGMPEFQSGGSWVGYDMPGYDIGNQRAGAFADCRAPCAANKACWAYSWTTYNGGTCWFKSQATEMVKSAGVTSTWLWKDWKFEGTGTCMDGVLHPYSRSA